jgi:SpoVK/Ycf46/Vps4 family AAA+-type ATPase
MLFTVENRGIVFFDDMGLALRDRDTVSETDDQAVFLNALDGISVQRGVVFVFTTNCAPELIDRAFRRPGRLDVVLHFREPDAPLRSRLIDRWHEDIRGGLDIDQVIRSTEGFSRRTSPPSLGVLGPRCLWHVGRLRHRPALS